MQTKGVNLYIFDPVADAWVKWEAAPGGAGAVTLYDTAGRAIRSESEGTIQKTLQANERNLSISGQTFLLSATSDTDTRLRVFTEDGDALANLPTSGARYAGVSSRNYGFNGTTWDRTRSFAANADAVTAPTLGLIGSGGFPFLFNSTTWDRTRSLASNSDAQAAAQTGLTGAVARNQLFNGTTWDRARTASAANISATTQIGALVALPGEWTLTSAPAAGTVATATRAAGGAGVRHVLSSICADLTAVAAVTAPLTLVVRDGATGAGTILWQRRITAPAGFTGQIEVTGLHIVGSAATAMCAEFTAAPAGTDFETISATGYSVV